LPACAVLRGHVPRKTSLGTMRMQIRVALCTSLQWVLIGIGAGLRPSQGCWIGWDVNLLGLSGSLIEEKGECGPHRTFPGHKHSDPPATACPRGCFAIITPPSSRGPCGSHQSKSGLLPVRAVWATVVAPRWTTGVGRWTPRRAGLCWAIRGAGAIDFPGNGGAHRRRFSPAGGHPGPPQTLSRPNPNTPMHPNSSANAIGAGLCGSLVRFQRRHPPPSPPPREPSHPPPPPTPPPPPPPRLGSTAVLAALGASQISAAAAALSWRPSRVVEQRALSRPLLASPPPAWSTGRVAITSPPSGYQVPLQAL